MRRIGCLAAFGVFLFVIFGDTQVVLSARNFFFCFLLLPFTLLHPTFLALVRQSRFWIRFKLKTRGLGLAWGCLSYPSVRDLYQPRGTTGAVLISFLVNLPARANFPFVNTSAKIVIAYEGH
jgi:hypothetical protein